MLTTYLKQKQKLFFEFWGDASGILKSRRNVSHVLVVVSEENFRTWTLL